ncbi:MAG: deoxyribonuclease IV [Pirellulales bacterium]
MPILGAHMSIAGGHYKAVELAMARGCQCVQLFTKNSNQWRCRELTPQDGERFRLALEASGLAHPIAHDSYLINLASPDEALWRKSIAAFADELRRAEQLGLGFLVTHPGSSTTSSEEQGILRIIAALDQVHGIAPDLRVRTLLETTAGQGTALGWRFEHLARILDGVNDPDRLGVCVDTCHIFAAGYPLAGRRDYLATIRKLAKVIGLERVQAFHLNDSKRELGSRVDRHAHIGEGQLGLDPFRHLLNDPRFSRVPMYLETPKGRRDGLDLDVINLATLRGLVE